MKKTMENLLKTMVVITVIILIIILARYAWAKYIAEIKGKAEATIAQFKFTVNGQSDEEQNGIIFAVTRKDKNSKVEQNMLAPGTYGEIPITINAEGTETFLEYTINIALKNKPQNLKFYYDEEKTLEINVSQIDDFNSKFSRKGFLSFRDNDLLREEKIYWSWPIETGENEEQIAQNDEEDSYWMDKIMEMSISVTGRQVAEKPMYYVANYGDVVNYTTNGTTIRGVVVNKIADVVEIMPINDDGKGVVVGNLRLGYKEETTDEEQQREEAIESYNKALNLINKVAISEYNGATRALRGEDVNRLVGYTPNPSLAYTEGTTYTLGASGIKRFIVDELTKVRTTDGEILDALELQGISVGDTIIIGNKYGEKIIQSIIVRCSAEENTKAYYEYNKLTQNLLEDYFSNKYCWLASRSIDLYSGNCVYGIRGCSANSVGAGVLCSSNGTASFGLRPVIPVVSILSNFQANYDTESNEWNVN